MEQKERLDTCYGKCATWRKGCTVEDCRHYSLCWRETSLKKAGISVPTSQLDRKAHIWLEKDFIFSGEFAELISAAQIIFWPICTFWNKRTKEAFPSIQTISIMAGVSEQTVNKGLKDLAKKSPFGFEILKVKGKRHNVYRMELPFEKKSGDAPATSFKVNSFPIQCGAYQRLKPNEKKLLLGLKCYSQIGKFNTDLYFHEEGENLELEYGIYADDWIGTNLGTFWREIYPDRKCDFIRFDHSISREKICCNVGIVPGGFKGAFEGLKKAGLVGSIGKANGAAYKIFTRTKDDKIPSRLRFLYEVCESAKKKGCIP